MMTKAQFFKWLDQHADRDYYNPWHSYEAAKGATKRELCNFRNNPDWKLYDHYQPMIVEWAGVYDDSRIAN